MKDYVVPLLKDEVADSFMNSLKQSELKPYTEEQSKETDKRIEEILSKKLTREQVQKIFDYGRFFELKRQRPDMYIGSFPADNYKDAIDYAYQLVVENNYDEECLQCKRFASGSCIGTINRGRKVITDENRCAALILKEGD